MQYVRAYAFSRAAVLGILLLEYSSVCTVLRKLCDPNLPRRLETLRATLLICPGRGEKKKKGNKDLLRPGLQSELPCLASRDLIDSAP